MKSERPVTRIALVLALGLSACSQPEEGASTPALDKKRAAIEAALASVRDSGDAASEKAAVQELARFLKERSYTLRVERRIDGKPRSVDKAELTSLAAEAKPVTVSIACPHAPPVTPWIEHRFKDNKTLGLLGPFVSGS